MERLFLFLGFAVVFVSCKKSTLELKYPNLIRSSTYWNTENDVSSTLAATYGLLRNVDGGFWGVRGVELSNGRGDDYFIRNDIVALFQLSTLTNTPDNDPAD